MAIEIVITRTSSHAWIHRNCSNYCTAVQSLLLIFTTSEVLKGPIHGARRLESPTAMQGSASHRKAKCSTEILAGAVIAGLQYSLPLRHHVSTHKAYRWILAMVGVYIHNWMCPRLLVCSYGAPECVWRSKQNLDTIIASTSQDCWSLGIIAYELLTGQPAFVVAPGTNDAVGFLASALSLLGTGFADNRLGVQAS
jgi:hypothetical protein